MNRLALYLTRLFAVDTLSFFVVAAFLVWITQALRLFDLVTAKGQDFLTLMGQATLTMPPLALTISFLCVGIGMARALRALQASRELHTIHAGGRTNALWLATALFALGSLAAVSVLAHWVEPWSKKSYAQWTEEIAADLVGRALNPNRFSEVVPGLVIVIGGRQRDGTITNFFANDTRDANTRRTYIAKEAIIVSSEDGYNLSLRDGAIQYARSSNDFSEIAFSRYELGLDRLVESGGVAQSLAQTSTPQILATTNGFRGPAAMELAERFGESVRILAICLLALALIGFPHARRGSDKVPVEVFVLVVGLLDRVVSAVSLSSLGAIGHFSGPIVVLFIATLLIGWQLFGRRFSFARRVFN